MAVFEVIMNGRFWVITEVLPSIVWYQVTEFDRSDNLKCDGYTVRDLSEVCGV